MKRWSMLGILVAALCALAFWGAPVLAGETMDKIENSGQTLIDEETYRRMGLGKVAEPIEPLTVKGFSKPVSVYKLMIQT